MAPTTRRLAATAAVAALTLAGLATATPAHANDITRERLAGADRYATSVAISKAGFPDRARTVFVASGENFPDALAGGAAAGAKEAPLLLTRAQALPEGVKAEIARLSPSSIVVLGGDAAVGAPVLDQLKAMGTVTVLAGADRYETAAKVAAFAHPEGATTAYVASGVAFPDALSGASAAAKAKAPVLLTRPAALSPATREAAEALGVKSAMVLGGSSAVAADVADTLERDGIAVKRVQGADRYLTSVEVSKASFETSSTVYVASGANFPDALSGAALAAGKAPILLVRPTAQTPDVCAEITRLKATKIVAFGGEAAITDGVLNSLPGCGDSVPVPPVTPGPGTPDPVPPTGCTIVASYDQPAARSALDDLVKGVRELDGRINHEAGFGGNVDNLKSAADRLASAGAPNYCAETLSSIRAGVQKVYDHRDNVAVARPAFADVRAQIVAALPSLNQALGTGYSI